MHLDTNIVRDALSSRRRLGKLFSHYGDSILDDFCVSEYVECQQLRTVLLNGQPSKLPATAYYQDTLYFCCDLPELLHGTGLQKDTFCSLLLFPGQFRLYVFSSGIVAEIWPDSLETEFLQIAPVSGGTSGMPQHFASRIAMLEFVDSFLDSHTARLELLRKMDSILEYLRSGRGRKSRFFGIF